MYSKHIENWYFKIHAIDSRRGEPQVARPLPGLMYSKHIENWYYNQFPNKTNGDQ